MKAANTSFMAVCNQSPLRVPRIHKQRLLMLCPHLLFGCGRQRISVVFEHYGGQYIKKRQGRTKVIILQCTVEYLNATIHRKTQKPEPEVGADRCNRPRQILQVDRDGSQFGRPRGGGSSYFGLLRALILLP